ncbi:MAG: hypothetical protein LBH44_06045 [Treponema sp.]|jgi:hypothetical protein|nr:hypothetical protein [Treponema sp.]
MKYQQFFLSVALIAITVICLSCASSVKTPETEAEVSFLPLNAGWYQYDFERTFKGIEDEYNFAKATGMKMVQELTWKYTGVVCRFEEGVLFDPVTGIELSIDSEGMISCAENISIKGKLENNGRFFWSGLKEEHGRLNSIFVKGDLSPLPPSVRGGGEFDGVYRLIDTGTGREMLTKISGGFYTWHYLDGKEAGFTPWPTLIRPDGSFTFSMDLTTVMEMGEMQKMNYSTGFTSNGKVVPGQGISIEEISRSAGMGQNQSGGPQIYAGTAIRSGEYPNDAIPADIENLVRAGRAAVKIEPKPNPAQYPSWYLRPPVKSGFLYASGEKTFAVKETAFAMAEAAAAANIAETLWVRIESSILDNSVNGETRVDERIKTETLQRLDYRIVERHYNDVTHTAFVLAELSVDQ